MKNSELLEQLQKERNHYPSDKDKMNELISILVDRGVYHETPMIKLWKNDPEKYKYCSQNPILSAVESWGAYWHTYNGPTHCPRCKTDLRDYEMGPPGKREISIYDRDLDMTVYNQCPDCGERIDRQF